MSLLTLSPSRVGNVNRTAVSTNSLPSDLLIIILVDHIAIEHDLSTLTPVFLNFFHAYVSTVPLSKRYEGGNVISSSSNP